MLKEVCDGVRLYFNKALGSVLLYKFERQQYSELRTDDVLPCDLYGVEHLLRLFVQMVLYTLNLILLLLAYDHCTHEYGR